MLMNYGYQNNELYDLIINMLSGRDKILSTIDDLVAGISKLNLEFDNKLSPMIEQLIVVKEHCDSSISDEIRILEQIKEQYYCDPNPNLNTAS